MSYTAAPSSPVAVSLRVADVRRAAAFYQQIGFHQVMAVPDESDEWLLCLLRFGNGSILLGALDHRRFPRASRQRRAPAVMRKSSVRICLDVPDLLATYRACVRAHCRISTQLTQDIWGGRGFSFLDPFGYEWELTQTAERLDLDLHSDGYDDRMALACQCGTIAALIQ